MDAVTDYIKKNISKEEEHSVCIVKRERSPELSRDKVTFGMLHVSPYLTFKQGHWQYTEVLLEVYSVEHHCVTENKVIVIK